ncbi:MAG TPA: CHAT domain-containing protein, partial [Chloroflexota bacterium]
GQAKLLLQRLHAFLIAPVADIIDDAKRLVIVPQGILHSIPFAALYDGSRFAVERYELVLQPSSSAIAFCRGRRPRRRGEGCVVIAHTADGRLPGALDEGEGVARLFGARRLFEARATLAGAYEHLRRARLVHIAAHGQSRPDSPLFSHIRLADGQLTALDCLGLVLDCDLITLSACETGQAVMAAGDEPIGLTRSLLYAGARSIVQSLWRVDDQATHHLMSDMYRRLRGGEGRAQALCSAQRAFVGETAPSGYAHPVFWAAFGLVGDWRPLQ